MANLSIKKGDHRPWGPVIALLAGCFVVVVGILRGLGPETILIRAAAVGLVCGVAVSVVRFTIRFFTS